jgi:hypothetical protein
MVHTYRTYKEHRSEVFMWEKFYATRLKIIGQIVGKSNSFSSKLISVVRFELGLWVRIPLEAWMSVCVYSVFVLFVCAGSSLGKS